MNQIRTLSGFLVAALCLLGLGCASTLGVQKGGFNLISLDQEWEMREDLQRQVAQEYELVRDPQALAYLNRIGRELAAQTDLGGRPWDFGIVRDDSLNAFNLPGGLVYVNVGLIEASDDLEMLTGVLAHEVAHGAARHGTQLMTRQVGYGVLISLILGRDAGALESTLADLVGTGVLLDYSRDAEREADRLGVRYAWEAGYDPEGLEEFFEKLLELQDRRPSDVERFFSSHPVTGERIENVRELRAQLPEKSLVSDTREFQEFRARFR